MPNMHEKLDEVLHCPMEPNEVGASTVGEYLVELLRTLWREGSCFSSKRPFGSSDWQWAVYRALADEGIVDAVVDNNNEIIKFDTRVADKLIDQAIGTL